MLSWDVYLPAYLLVGALPDSLEQDNPVLYVSDLQEKVHTIHDITRAQVYSKASNHQKEGYDHRLNFHSYKIGGYVFLHQLVGKKGLSP